MDNSWQLKCGSSTQSMASSTSQEPRTQTEMDYGYYFYPHVAYDLRSAGHGKMQDSTVPYIQNATSCRQDNAELGNSFLSLLSAPPSLLQCDFQQQSNLKSFCASSSKHPFDGGALTSTSIRSGVPSIANGVLSECQSNRNIQNGVNPILSSRGVVNSNCSTKYVLHEGLETVNGSLQSSDLAKAVIHQLVSSNERASDFSSLKGKWHSTSLGHAAKIPSSCIPISHKAPLQSNSSLPCQPPICSSEYPRVFCLGASGNLLLSDTGLLGIVCSCHHFHTSVAKFCEHLGLCDVNPGDAVYMESGETIAQWRKLYLQKFGIRVSDYQTGWDWPEALSAPDGLVRSGVAASNMPNNSDLAKLVGSSGGFLKSGQPLDTINFPKNPHRDQNLVIDFINPRESNNHAVADNLMMEFQTSRCSTSSEFVDKGPDGGLQSIPAYIDSFLKSRDSSVTNPSSENSRTYCENYDGRKIKNACNAVIADRIAISSNIELRLGQPYQQSQSSGISIPSVTRPKLLDTLVPEPKSFFLEQMTNNATNCGERVAPRQYFQCSAAPGKLSATEVSHLNLGQQVFGISNVTDTTKLYNFDGNVTKSTVVPSLTHVNTPPERNSNSKVNNHTVWGDYIMPKSVHSESYAAKSNQVCVPWTVVNGSERQLNVSEFFRIKDKGKGVGSTADGSYSTTDSESNIQKQWESRGIFPVAMSGSRDLCSSAVHGKSHYSYQSSGLPPDALDARNLFNHPEKVPCLGSSRHTDNLFLTSKGSPRGSSQLLQSQAVSMAFPLATSTSMLGMASAVSKLEGNGVSPYLLDDNMRFVALRQILELSKQQHAISSLGMDRETGRLGNFSNVNIHPFVEPSAFGEQTSGPNITSQRDTSEVAMPSPTSGAYTRMGVNIEKSGLVTDLNNSRDFSTWMCGNPLLSREVDLQCQFPCEPPTEKQIPLRRELTSTSIENAKCYQGVSCAYFLGHCSCAAYTKCLGGNCKSRIGNTPNTFKEQLGTINDEASVLVVSEFVKDGTGPKEKPISSAQRAKVIGQVPKSNVCPASQWKDVPSKFKGVSNVTCLDQSAADLLDGRDHREGQLGDTATKCSYGNMTMPESLKEQEMSNISSGCSAAAVTHASIQGNNIDSATVSVGNTRCVNNHVVDEGSDIDKCWSSDDALESERSAEFLGSKEGSSKNINNRSSHNLLDELKLLNSLTWKKSRKQIHSKLAVQGKINFKQIERCIKTGKRKSAKKFKKLVSQYPTAGPSTVHYERPRGTGSLACSSKEVEMLNPSFLETYISGTCSLQPNSKCGRSTLSSSKELSCKRDLHMIDGDTDRESDYQIESNSYANAHKTHEFSGMKELGRAQTSDCIRKSQMEESTHAHSKNDVKCGSVGCMKALSRCEVNTCFWKTRPVVYGKYGEIRNELTGDVPWPLKIVPLSRILKTSRRCTLPKTGESKQTFFDELKKTSYCGSGAGYIGFSNLKKAEESAIDHSLMCNEMNIDPSVDEDEKICTNGDRLFDEENSMSEKENVSKKNGSMLNRNVHIRLKPKSKEIRKRSLCELTENGKKSSSESLSLVKISKCMPKMKAGKVSKNAVDDKHHIHASSKVNSQKINQEQNSLSVTDSDAFCCVCGGSNKDENNCLLDCSRCFIKVHQACYGVSRVPKDHWYCRPCRTNSRDIVCVLCGYGGGAMTRALRSRTIVKGLFKAWNIETESRHKNAVSSAQIMEDDLSMLHSTGSVLESSTFPVLRPANIEPSTTAWKVDLQNQLDTVQKFSCGASNLKVHNSITAGALDSTAKQWVHMVCGLWTPGTRCPNVDTMSAFDVSGASQPKAIVACSMCNRAGGSCIKCRVVNCSVKFHPWCAHQKGLLQSEVEGVENENVGFYGRCVLHATHPLSESGSDPIDFVVDCSIGKEFTCARTEGYKGRKRDGFWHNLYGQSRGKGACLVPQEQINAWIHINGQKSSKNGLPKLLVSDVEYDFRKEYARYKQAKGWKHLVVYKSGIHALGLYTSRFISRGEMVVEYVGEIVGLRVADKRETEYQLGRKLQYKSACYFFRIDKEHIIDATCKGGIARFVNHSCLPNCVARVISVRNEKKVVFFAERDIYPGEEITYDYHFNHEDEGKKIHCFCNSKNCRRYLN